MRKGMKELRKNDFRRENQIRELQQLVAKLLKEKDEDEGKNIGVLPRL